MRMDRSLSSPETSMFMTLTGQRPDDMRIEISSEH